MGEKDLSVSNSSEPDDISVPNGPETSDWHDTSMENSHHVPVYVPEGESEPMTPSETRLNRSIRSMTSKASVMGNRSGQSLRSMTSKASFKSILDTFGGQQSEDKEEEEAILNEMIHGGAPVPPDGGYGWVIVFASFVCNLVLDGITCTFGVFLPQMAESFDAGKGQVAWAGSLLCGGSLCIGPIVGACTNKFGCRTVCMVGSAVACIGFILSSFADSLTLMLLSYGVLGAIGFGFIYLPNIVSVGYYFEKRRALATGIAVCGSGFGATSFAPMASWLSGRMSWRTVNLIYAGLLFICGCCGALIRPLEIKREALDDFADDEDLVDLDPKRRPLLYRMAEERKQHFEKNSISGSEYFMVQLPDGTMERRQKLPLNIDPGVHSTFHLDQFQFTGSHPPLSTITETEQKQSSGSEGSTDLEKLDEGIGRSSSSIEIHPRGINIPVSRSSSHDPNLHNSRKTLGSKEIDLESPHYPKGSSHDPMHDDHCLNDDEQRSSHDQRRFSFKAVPGSIISARFFSKRNSEPSPIGSRRESFSIAESIDEPLQMKSDLPSIHPSLKWTPGSISGSSGSVHRIIRPLSRKDIFYSGSITHLPEYTQNPLNYRQSILSLHTVGSVQKDFGGTKPTFCPTLTRRIAATVKSLQSFMDFTLLRNPVFLCIALSGVVGMLGFYVPFVYIIDFCAEKDIPRDDAALLISIIGAMNTVGRVGFGMLSDLKLINSLYLNNICLLGMGVVVGLVPWCPTYVSLIVIYVLFGLFLSGFIALTSITLVDLLGLDNLTNAFGLLMFFRGFASIIGSPFAGFLYDTFQSYDVPFMLAGMFLVASSLISSTIPFVTKFATAKDTRRELTNPFHPALSPILEDIPEAREPDEEMSPFDDDIEQQSTPTDDDNVAPEHPETQKTTTTILDE